MLTWKLNIFICCLLLLNIFVCFLLLFFMVYQEKDQLYDILDKLVESGPKYDAKIVIGDYNGKIGFEGRPLICCLQFPRIWQKHSKL